MDRAGTSTDRSAGRCRWYRRNRSLLRRIARVGWTYRANKQAQSEIRDRQPRVARRRDCSECHTDPLGRRNLDLSPKSLPHLIEIRGLEYDVGIGAKTVAAEKPQITAQIGPSCRSSEAARSIPIYGWGCRRGRGALPLLVTRTRTVHPGPVIVPAIDDDAGDGSAELVQRRLDR